MLEKLITAGFVKAALAIIAALLMVIAGLSATIWGLPIIGGGLLAKLESERAAHDKTKADYRLAQAEAEAAARKAKADQEARYRAHAERTDANAEKAIADARAAAERYIARMRPQGTPGAPGGPAASPDSGSAPDGNRPGGEAELVLVSADDIRICSVNTARLEAVRDWSLGLNSD